MDNQNATIYRPFGTVLMRDEDGRALAMSCKRCGHFALDTESGLCAVCGVKHDLMATARVLGNARALLK